MARHRGGLGPARRERDANSHVISLRRRRPRAPSAPMSPFKAPRSPKVRGAFLIWPLRSYSRTYFGYSTFRRRKKPRHGNTFASSETVRSEVAPCLCWSDGPTCRGARLGDEGKAVGRVPPTALLFRVEARGACDLTHFEVLPCRTVFRIPWLSFLAWRPPLRCRCLYSPHGVGFCIEHARRSPPRL